VGGWMDGWVDGWVGGWMDGWMGGWMDGWMDALPCFLVCSSVATECVLPGGISQPARQPASPRIDGPLASLPAGALPCPAQPALASQPSVHTMPLLRAPLVSLPPRCLLQA